jgi:SpoVK/Ycf46/Vps4 family AAA+-type ATPase
LIQFDGTKTSSEDRLLMIGATNRPYELDEVTFSHFSSCNRLKAALRRFTKKLYIPLPNKEARFELIKTLVNNDVAKGNRYVITDEVVYSFFAGMNCIVLFE